jgi:hypothetical protein
VRAPRLAVKPLGSTRGNLIDRATQRWVRHTGRRVDPEAESWLDGPIGEPSGIGASFFETWASGRNVRLLRGQATGLIPDLSALRSATFEPDSVASSVARFYTHSSAYELDAWSEWTGAFRPFGWALAVIFSRRLQQLNVPLSNLDTSRGMTSEVVPIVDRESGSHQFTAWVRTLVGSGHVIYAGAYSTCVLPDGQACVRVVFPLPNGNAMVLMRPVAHADGSLSLESVGERFGNPGFYFTVRDRHGRLWARYLRALRETIHVASFDREIRADHVLTLWGLTFLRLHYRLRPSATTESVE